MLGAFALILLSYLFVIFNNSFSDEEKVNLSLAEAKIPIHLPFHLGRLVLELKVAKTSLGSLTSKFIFCS